MATVPVRELMTIWGFDVDDKPVQQLERSVKGIKSTLKEIGIGFVAAAAGVGFFLKKAGDFEQYNIAFETMLGNAELAKKTLSDLFDFARTTPFDIKGVIVGAKRLLAFGFQAKDLIGIMDTLGNITAGVGTENLPRLILALGQVRAATRLRGQELRQFTEAGVPLIEELSKTLNVAEKDIASLVSAGKVSFEDVLKALENLTTGTGRFANLMQRQSRSFLGILSNIRDVVTLLSKDIGDDLLPEAKALANEFLEFLDVNRELIKSGMVKFMRSLFEFGKDLVTIIRSAVRVFQGFAQAVGGSEEAIRLLLTASSALLALKLAFHFGNIGVALANLALKYRVAGGAALFAQAKMLLLPLAITAIVAALALITEDIVAFTQGRDSVLGRFVNAFQEAFPGLKILFENIGLVMDFILIPIQQTITAIRLLGALIDRIGSSALLDKLINIIPGLGAARAGLQALGASDVGQTFTEALNRPAGESVVTSGGGGGGQNISQSAQLNVDVRGLDPDAAIRAASSAIESTLDGILRDAGRSAESAIER